MRDMLWNGVSFYWRVFATGLSFAVFGAGGLARPVIILFGIADLVDALRK